MKYVAMPSPEAADAVALWIVATHAQPAWEHASRLVIKSPLKRCGKTRCLEIVSELANNVLRTTNISTAALVRSLDESDPRTLVLDEGDTIFSRRRGEASEKSEDLRGILNSGHSRGWPYIRYNPSKNVAEYLPTFSMAAIAAIGGLPDTIEDRAVVIEMRRRSPDEYVAPFRRSRDVGALTDLRDRVHAWVGSIIELMPDTEVDLPVEDRAADVWESLAITAVSAGGEWPSRARQACLALTKGADDVEGDSASERLLADMHGIFHPKTDEDAPLPPVDKLTARELIDALKAIEDAPWEDWNNARGLSPRGLAQLLRPYGVRPVKRSGGWRGYLRADLVDVWSRYRGSSAQSAQAPQTPDFESKNPVADAEIASATTSATSDSDSSVAVGRVGAHTHLNGANGTSEAFVEEVTL
ncbi:MAG: DUF3631 domain-containing protein [Dehalococcoidia bacterium]